MSIYNIQRFVPKASNECYSHLTFVKDIDDTCTKVTCKILSSRNKAIRHTYTHIVVLCGKKL